MNPLPVLKFDPEHLCESLQNHSLYVGDSFLTHSECSNLRREIESLQTEGKLKDASIGRASGLQNQKTIRSDQTFWLPDSGAPFGNQIHERIVKLKEDLNPSLLLGLWDFEGHYAYYPPGGHYQAHFDRFGSDARRTVSTIVYLNPPDWDPTRDGGNLRIHPGSSTSWQNPFDIAPLGGRIVCFLSSEILHEVLPAQRARMSLTGWFRTR